MVLFVFCAVSSSANEMPLAEKMKAMDTALFEYFNNCQHREALDKHASFFSADVEFYHDNGGVTWDRDTMISNTKKMPVVIILANLLPVPLKPTQLKRSVQSRKACIFFAKITARNVRGKPILSWFGVIAIICGKLPGY